MSWDSSNIQKNICAVYLEVGVVKNVQLLKGSICSSGNQKILDHIIWLLYKLCTRD